MANTTKKTKKPAAKRVAAVKESAPSAIVTKLDVDNLALLTHAVLQDRYYNKHELTKAEFDDLHRKLWQDHNADLVARGFRQEEKAELA